MCVISLLGLLALDVDRPVRAQAPTPIAIIVHQGNPVSDVAVEDLRHLYLGVRTAFPGGDPVLLLESPTVRERFYTAALEMTEEGIKRDGIGMAFSGEPAVPPKEVADVRELRRLVRSHRGAVAFIDARKADAMVKVLKIHGALPGDPGYTLNMLAIRRGQRALGDRAGVLEQEVRGHTEAIHAREHETILRVARAAEYRDWETGSHIVRVAWHSRISAKHLGLSDTDQEMIFKAAPMHDIGKVGVPDYILLKPSGLDDHEFSIMKEHTLIGHRILGGEQRRVAHGLCRDRPEPSRAVERVRVSGGPRGEGHPHRRPDRGGGWA
jgi:hypothetical protein